jgi:hydroxymethylglutaryl-CoA lyase
MRQNVQIVEVGPRDGLQNESVLVNTAAKSKLIERLIAAGVRRIEVASFVHPGRVPQMADAEAVIAALPDRSDVSYIGLCLNKRGVLRALETRSGGARGVDEVGCVLVATDTFGQKNQGQTIAEGITENAAMIRFAKAEGMKAQVTISAAFGCPFEGDVPANRIIELAQRMAEEEPMEIALADTIGVGVPAQVEDLFGRLRQVLPESVRLRAHFHNTRGTGIANAWAALQSGVDVLDASLGGLGGCPFAPGATGNISTEDLVFMLDKSGVGHGLVLSELITVNHWFENIMGRTLPSMVARAARA